MDFRNVTLRTRKHRRIWVVGSLSIVAMLATAVGLVRLGPALPTLDRSNLWIGSVHRGTLIINVRADGILLPKVRRWIAASSAAEVDRILVSPGSVIQANTVLMDLSNPEILGELSRARNRLAQANADLAAKRTGMQLASAAERALLAYPWPGNVRELRHILERAALLSDSTTVNASILGLGESTNIRDKLEQMTLDQAEAYLVQRALQRHTNHMQAAADALSITRQTLYRRLERHGLRVACDDTACSE